MLDLVRLNEEEVTEVKVFNFIDCVELFKSSTDYVVITDDLDVENRIIELIQIPTYTIAEIEAKVSDILHLENIGGTFVGKKSKIFRVRIGMEKKDGDA